MATDAIDSIEQIKNRIYELQKSHVSLQEQFKSFESNTERNLNDMALRIISILDMIEMTLSNVTLDHNPNASLIIKKIEKQLINLLQHSHVQEITLLNNKVELGKVRVIEVQKTSENLPSGSILKICRKGYERGDKIIRPIDVITSESS